MLLISSVLIVRPAMCSFRTGSAVGLQLMTQALGPTGVLLLLLLLLLLPLLLLPALVAGSTA